LGSTNEHAETGKPDGSSDEQRSQGNPASLDYIQRLNGPAHVDLLVGVGLAAFSRRIVDESSPMGGHKLSASGLPQRSTRIT
jgi:hypothetical protein